MKKCRLLQFDIVVDFAENECLETIEMLYIVEIRIVVPVGV